MSVEILEEPELSDGDIEELMEQYRETQPEFINIPLEE